MTGIIGTHLANGILPLTVSKLSQVFHLIEEKTDYNKIEINEICRKEWKIGAENLSLLQCFNLIIREGDSAFITGEWIEYLFFGKKKPDQLEITFKVQDHKTVLARLNLFFQVHSLSFQLEKRKEGSLFQFSFEIGEKVLKACFLIENKKESVSTEPFFNTVALQVTTPFLNQTQETMTVCAYGQEGFSVDQGVVYTTIENRKRNIVENFFLFDIGMGEIEELPSKILETKNYPPDMLEMFLKTLGGDLHLKVLSSPKIINVFVNYLHKHFPVTSLFEKIQCIFEIVFFLELGKAGSLIDPFLEQAGGAIRKSLRLENRDVLSRGLSVLNSLSAKEISSTVLLQKWQKILQFLVLYTLQTNSSLKGVNIEFKLMGKKQFAFLSLEGGEGFHINLPESTELADVSEEEVFACFPLEDFSFESLPLEHRKEGRVFFGKVQVEQSLAKKSSLSTLATFMTTTTFNENSILHRNLLFSFLHHNLSLIGDQPYKGLFEQLLVWSGFSFKEYLQNPFTLFKTLYEDKDLLKHLLTTAGKNFFVTYFPSTLQLQESEKAREAIKTFFQNKEISLSIKRFFAATVFPPYAGENKAFLIPFVESLITKEGMPLEGLQLHALSPFHDEINRRQIALFPKVQTKEEALKGKKQTDGYKTLEKNLKGKKEAGQLNEIVKIFKNLSKEEKGVVFEIMVSLLLRMQAPPEKMLRELLEKTKEYWNVNPAQKGILLTFCYSSSEMKKAYEEHLKDAPTSLFKIYFFPEKEVEAALSLDVFPETKEALKERSSLFAGHFSRYLLTLQHPHSDSEIIKKAIHYFIKEGSLEEVQILLSKYEKTSLCFEISETLAPLKGKWGAIFSAPSNIPFCSTIFPLIDTQGEIDTVLEELFTSKIPEKNALVSLELLTPFCRTRKQKERLLTMVVDSLKNFKGTDGGRSHKELLLKIFRMNIGENSEGFLSELFQRLPFELQNRIISKIPFSLSADIYLLFLERLEKNPIDKTFDLNLKKIPYDRSYKDSYVKIFLNPLFPFNMRLQACKELVENKEELHLADFSTFFDFAIDNADESEDLTPLAIYFEQRVRIGDGVPIDFLNKIFLSPSVHFYPINEGFYLDVVASIFNKPNLTPLEAARVVQKMKVVIEVHITAHPELSNRVEHLLFLTVEKLMTWTRENSLEYQSVGNRAFEDILSNFLHSKEIRTSTFVNFCLRSYFYNHFLLHRGSVKFTILERNVECFFKMKEEGYEEEIQVAIFSDLMISLMGIPKINLNGKSINKLSGLFFSLINCTENTNYLRSFLTFCSDLSCFEGAYQPFIESETTWANLINCPFKTLLFLSNAKFFLMHKKTRGEKEALAFSYFEQEVVRDLVGKKQSVFLLTMLVKILRQPKHDFTSIFFERLKENKEEREKFFFYLISTFRNYLTVIDEKGNPILTGIDIRNFLVALGVSDSGIQEEGPFIKRLWIDVVHDKDEAASLPHKINSFSAEEWVVFITKQIQPNISYLSISENLQNRALQFLDNKPFTIDTIRFFIFIFTKISFYQFPFPPFIKPIWNSVLNKTKGLCVQQPCSFRALSPIYEILLIAFFGIIKKHYCLPKQNQKEIFDSFYKEELINFGDIYQRILKEEKDICLKTGGHSGNIFLSNFEEKMIDKNFLNLDESSINSLKKMFLEIKKELEIPLDFFLEFTKPLL